MKSFKISIQSIEIEKFQGQSIGHEVKILKKDSAEMVFVKKPKAGDKNIKCFYSPPTNGKEREICVDYVLVGKEHCFIWATKKCSLVLKTFLPFCPFEKQRVAKWKE